MVHVGLYEHDDEVERAEEQVLEQVDVPAAPAFFISQLLSQIRGDDVQVLIHRSLRLVVQRAVVRVPVRIDSETGVETTSRVAPMRRRRARGEVVILARVVQIDRHAGQAQRVARPAKPARARKRSVSARRGIARSEASGRGRVGARRAFRRGRDRETPGLEKTKTFRGCLLRRYEKIATREGRFGRSGTHISSFALYSRRNARVSTRRSPFDRDVTRKPPIRSVTTLAPPKSDVRTRHTTH